ncbi:hypothetical protein FQA47_014665 [Oryzias melastigma]|uniref:Uncharacterized protein n=1 Tax=Oryzias melastigma TaxID=30732 RepID=A0A834F3Q1_ORYME|nr:hypothetical protein FQA47_014665 [Oryzias melastigma]
MWIHLCFDCFLMNVTSFIDGFIFSPRGATLLLHINSGSAVVDSANVFCFPEAEETQKKDEYKAGSADSSLHPPAPIAVSQMLYLLMFYEWKMGKSVEFFFSVAKRKEELS